METKTGTQDPEQQLLSSASSAKWKRLGTQRRSGVLVPLFSVYSKNSVGIGEYRDLKILVDWCAETGNSILQLLPMNDVGPLFCPYDSTSSFALEPMYVSLELVLADPAHPLAKKISALKKKFPAGKSHVNYRIKEEKLRLLWDIFNESAYDVKALQGFCDCNAYWLEDYALFTTLKSLHEDKAWFEWPEKYRSRKPASIESLKEEQEKAVTFHTWVQWHLYTQFKEVKDYAAQKGVLLKGDLPILVSRDSADVWAHPEYFKMDFVAGAPPDMYCAKGQRWGTPTYQWDRIFDDAGVYVEEKLKYAQNFYDILRIDHVVGLFRIWSIPYADPLENLGLNGAFDPRDEKVWEDHGRRILEFMHEHTTMLLCAEDLGVIPPCCPKVLKELGIAGNDVQRWTKDWDKRHDFSLPEEFRFLAVAMLATHDTTNCAGWWENEAGTIDEALFIRKCADRAIDHKQVMPQLFDTALSRHARLRWRNEINSVDRLVMILGRPREQVKDFVDLYLNSYQEKEKLWKLVGLEGAMREESDSKIVEAVLRYVLRSNAVFVINLLNDWLFFADKIKGDPYDFRINTPGTISEKNWSLTVPVSLEDLLALKANKQIRSMIKDSSR